MFRGIERIGESRAGVFLRTQVTQKLPGRRPSLVEKLLSKGGSIDKPIERPLTPEQKRENWRLDGIIYTVESLSLEERRVLARVRAKDRAEKEGRNYVEGSYESKDMAWTRRLKQRNPAGQLKALDEQLRTLDETTLQTLKGPWFRLVNKRNRLREEVDRIEKFLWSAHLARVLPIESNGQKKSNNFGEGFLTQVRKKRGRIGFALGTAFTITVVSLLANSHRDSSSGTQVSRDPSIQGPPPPAQFVDTSPHAAQTTMDAMARPAARAIGPVISGELALPAESSVKEGETGDIVIFENGPEPEEEAMISTDDAFASFLNASVEIEPGDSLFKIINDLSEQSGGNWVNGENGVTRGHVLAAIITNYMRQKGFNPNLIYPGDIFSLQALGMPEAWLAVLEKTWKTKSPQDYIEHVLPNAQKLLRR